MPWTAMHWTVFALLCLLAIALVVIVRLLDGRPGHEHGHVPTRAQRRAWKRERLPIVRVNRRRSS